MINIEPNRVFYYFEEINKIPRCSGNEKKISDYLVNFAKNHNLEVVQDDSMNVIIKKEASLNYENVDGVILQGHMDMVCEKSTNSKHDFTKDPISSIINGNIISANGTTLGADNGIAIAMGLAILEDDNLTHPKLELLVTTSEETDMSGALNLSKNVLNGKFMINIDSEEEGILTVGSAGGIDLFISKKVKTEECKWNSYKITFDGLLGGHSGMQIHENRGNMIKVMVYFLEKINTVTNYRVNQFEAGTYDNAIPRSGNLIIQAEELKDELITKIVDETKDHFKSLMGNLTISVNSVDTICNQAWIKEISDSVIHLIREMPTGVNSFVSDTKLVESSDNLALIKERNGEIYIEVSVRSSNIRVQDVLVEKCAKIVEKYEFDYNLGAEYPGWEYREKSHLRDTAKKVYNELYNNDFETLVIHAGLECGAIASKYPDIDMISIGPNISGAHTPSESLEIDSVKRVYEFLLELLKKIK